MYDRELRLRIACVDVPALFQGRELSLGIQRGEDVEAGALQPDGSLRFDFVAGISPSRDSGQPDFRGPYIQGPRGGRFVYLVWTVWDGGGADRCGRMKVPLPALTWEVVEEAEGEGGVLAAAVSGTGRNGGPAFATVPLLGAGWTVEP